MDTRTEHDSMGPIEVPADHLWGAQTQRSLQHFDISGERMPREMIHALVRAKRACAVVNQSLAGLAPDKARAIEAAAEEVISGRWDAEFPLVIWQTGTNAAMRHMPLDRFEQRLRDGIKLGQSFGADFVLMSLQYAPAVVALQDEEVYERVMAKVATEVGAGLFRRYDIMRSWYDDGMPYAQFVQLDGLHLNDFGQKCIGRLLTRSILGALTGP